MAGGGFFSSGSTRQPVFYGYPAASQAAYRKNPPDSSPSGGPRTPGGRGSDLWMEAARPRQGSRGSRWIGGFSASGTPRGENPIQPSKDQRDLGVSGSPFSGHETVVRRFVGGTARAKSKRKKRCRGLTMEVVFLIMALSWFHDSSILLGNNPTLRLSFAVFRPESLIGISDKRFTPASAPLSC